MWNLKKTKPRGTLTLYAHPRAHRPGEDGRVPTRDAVKPDVGRPCAGGGRIFALSSSWAMLEEWLAGILRERLGKFLEISPKQLRMGVWSGELSLVRAPRDFLEYSAAPLTISRAPRTAAEHPAEGGLPAGLAVPCEGRPYGAADHTDPVAGALAQVSRRDDGAAQRPVPPVRVSSLG